LKKTIAGDFLIYDESSNSYRPDPEQVVRQRFHKLRNSRRIRKIKLHTSVTAGRTADFRKQLFRLGLRGSIMNDHTGTIPGEGTDDFRTHPFCTACNQH
jgi:hypothetical protein